MRLVDRRVCGHALVAIWLSKRIRAVHDARMRASWTRTPDLSLATGQVRLLSLGESRGHEIVRHLVTVVKPETYDHSVGASF